MDDLKVVSAARGWRSHIAQVAREALRPLLLSLLLCVGSAAAGTTSTGDIQARYHAALARAHSDAATTGTWPVTADYDELMELLHESAPEHIAVIVTANKDIVLSHVDRAETQTLLAQLLQLDAYHLAEQIRNAADETGDRYLRTKLNYEFARYHLNRREWQQCQQNLDRGVFANALLPEEKDYTSIMQGVLSQRRSMHRAAIPFYSEIPATSPHFAIAQLNLATVYIRQDWWTDAHRALLEAVKATNDKTFRDRLYTVLGFSQLQKEFYRDSRDSFRRVRTESPYSVRALFGLGMAALHQGDYSGALNAFRLLKQMGTYEKSVVESYLMLPVTFEKMGQVGPASASFNEAIAYYENYALELEENLVKLRRSPSEQALHDADRLSFLDTTTDAVDIALTRLHQAQQLPVSEATQRILLELMTDYRSLQNNLAVKKLEKNHDVVQHYLNQARFGLARLHDVRNKENP